jgi:uncharacterized protein YidB (DUF937 family)
MGMLDDILTTIQASGAASDPQARPTPAPAPGGAMAGHAMSPMAKALLALLAIYAAKNLRRAPSASTSPASPAAPPPGTTTAGTTGGGGLDDLLRGPLGDLLRGGTATGTGGGGLGDLLKGPLGGILGGAAAGTILNGGLGDLLKQLQQSGQADAVNSWVGSGPNKTIPQTDLGSALGTETLDQLSNYSGMPRGELLAGLSDHLPRVVDTLTPHGRMLTDQEAERML